MSVTWNDVTITLEVGFSAATGEYGAWDSAIWDTSEWGPDIVWFDVSAYLRRFNTRIGRNREDGHYQAGSATFVLANTDGRFSPDNTSGPYASGGITGIRPWRPVRLRAAYDGVTYSVFYGFVESFTDAFPGKTDAITTLSCNDGISLIAAYNGYEQSAVGSGETAGLRIHRILDNLGWTLERTIDSADTTVLETTLAQNAWTEILLTADSDNGAAWVDPDGTFIFEHQLALFENARSNSVQATFDDSTGLHYQDLTVDYSGDLLINVAKIARSGGTQRTATNETSRALYGDHLFSRNDLICETDTQVETIATDLVLKRGHPELRVQSFVVHPRAEPSTMWAQALGRRIRDRVQVSVTVPTTAVVIDRQCFIDGVEHSVDPSDWTTVFRTSSASAYPAASEFGIWDEDAWNETFWGISA